MGAEDTRAGWSRLNIALHWLIVVLIVAQWIEGDDMRGLWDGTLDNKPTDAATSFLGYTHIVFGSLILAAAMVRLLDRLVNGRPEYSTRDPNWATGLAKVTHVLLYAIVIVMPIFGLAAWFTGNDDIAGYHTFFWNPLLIVAGLHVVGALTQHFAFKSNALARMVPMLKAPS